jgi:hypothetical protein
MTRKKERWTQNRIWPIGTSEWPGGQAKYSRGIREVENGIRVRIKHERKSRQGGNRSGKTMKI